MNALKEIGQFFIFILSYLPKLASFTSVEEKIVFWIIAIILIPLIGYGIRAIIKAIR